MKRSVFKKNDLWILLAVLALALLLALPLFGKGKARIATVRYRGEAVDTVSLSVNEERVYSFPEGEVCVAFFTDGVSVVSSPCEGKDCVHMGKISSDGGGIFCLPLGFSVTLSGESPLDGITG